MRKQPITSYLKFLRIWILIILFGFSTDIALADDPGIHKVRLIQQNDSTYIFEVDVSQRWLWAIKTPIFPSRFKVVQQKPIVRDDWVVTRVLATTQGEPLNPRDEIILPWNRNGADVTAIWLDGSIHKGLFIKDITGIVIKMNQLLPHRVNMLEVFKENIRRGLNQLHFNLVYILFSIALVFYFKSQKVYKAFLYLILGHGVSLFLAEWGVRGFSILFTNILASVIAVYLIYQNLKKNGSAAPEFWLLFVFGLITGLSYHEELEILDLSVNDKVLSQFIFLFTLDLGIVCAITASYVIYKMKINMDLSKYIQYFIGSFSVAVILIFFNENVKKGGIDILQFRQSEFVNNYSLPLNEGNQSQLNKPLGKAEMIGPVMSFITIEPYEVRHEILVNARAAVQLIGVEDRGMYGIPISSLEAVKQEISNLIVAKTDIQIDNVEFKPEIVNTDFVTLSASGVLVRDKPIPESLDDGIIGLTIIYETKHFPDSLSLAWDIDSSIVPGIEINAVDPFGSLTVMLSENENTYKWKNSLLLAPNEALQAIQVENRQLPYLSYFLLGALLLFILIRLKKKGDYKKVALIILCMAILSFPFFRFHLNIPYFSHFSPSKEESEIIIEKLLTNMYKSFDVRDESMVYDRLELSVAGEKLTQIYLDNRKSLEFENRGGAKARIDKVSIIGVENITRIEDNTFQVPAKWMVNGAVSHFGHTHYRRNWYDALITFEIIDNNWKIKDIDLIEEKRIL